MNAMGKLWNAIIELSIDWSNRSDHKSPVCEGVCRDSVCLLRVLTTLIMAQRKRLSNGHIPLLHTMPVPERTVMLVLRGTSNFVNIAF